MSYYPIRKDVKVSPMDDADIEYLANKFLKIPEEELVRVLECLVKKLKEKKYE